MTVTERRCGGSWRLRDAEDYGPKHVEAFGEAAGHDHPPAAEQRHRARERRAERGGRLLQLFASGGSPARAAAISSRPSASPALLCDRVECRPCRMAFEPSVEFRRRRRSGSAEAQPKDAAAPSGPRTIRPSASTAEPIPVPIAMRIASETSRAAPSAASASSARWASLPSATATPGKQARKILSVEIGQVRNPDASGAGRQSRNRDPDARDRDAPRSGPRRDAGSVSRSGGAGQCPSATASPSRPASASAARKLVPPRSMPSAAVIP